MIMEPSSERLEPPWLIPSPNPEPELPGSSSGLTDGNREERTMKLKVVVHVAEEGGYWAEVPAIPGCATQGDSFEELLGNLYEAVEGCLSVDVDPISISATDKVVEIAV